METKDLGKTSTGIQANAAGALSYLLGFLTGIVFLLIEKENKFVRFHAMQSTITFGVLFVASIVIGGVFAFIPAIGWAFSSLLWVVQLILWIVLVIKAYQGELFKLPVFGDIAEKQISK